jgi:hypothetical protein
MKIHTAGQCFILGMMSSAALICQQADSPGQADRETLRKQLVQMFASELRTDRPQPLLSEIDASPLSPVTPERKTTATVTAKCNYDYVFDIQQSAFRCKKGSTVKLKVDARVAHSSTGWEFATFTFNEADQSAATPLVPGPVLPRPTPQSPQNKESVLKLAQSSGGRIVALAMGSYASLAFVEIAGNMNLRLVSTHGVTDVKCGSLNDGGDGRVVPLGCPGTTEVWVPPDVTRAEVYRLDGTATSAQVYTRGPQRFYRVQPGDQAIILVRQ